MLNLFVGLDTYTGLLLLLALVFVLFCEAIDGLHGTADTVATVVYTRAMQSQLAAVIAAFFNFFGALLGGLSVAYAIVHTLPIDLLPNMGSAHDLAMVFFMLLTATIWNLGTQFFGLPVSSSHILIDTVIDIGLTNALLTSLSMMDALNLREVTETFSSLIAPPVVGLVIAGGLIFLLCHFWSGTKKRDRICRTPKDCKRGKGKRKSPFQTRIALVVSTVGVAFSYDADDGQKGIGLAMLVLVGITPAGFVVNMNVSGYEITYTRDAVINFEHYLQQHPELPQKLTVMEPSLPATSIDGVQVTEFHRHPANTFDTIARVKMMLLGNMESYEPLSVSQRSQLRRTMLCISDTPVKLVKLPGASKEDQDLLKKLCSDVLGAIEYAPIWIIIAVALALDIDIMIGWYRIAMTIDEKVDKRDTTYAQGMTVQVTATVSIGLASYTGMPVSTTRVLLSAVAGTMVVGDGRLQRKTVTSILATWIFTLPAAISLSSGLYWVALQSV